MSKCTLPILKAAPIGTSLEKLLSSCCRDVMEILASPLNKAKWSCYACNRHRVSDRNAAFSSWRSWSGVRTFTQAISLTSARGEVIVLTSAGYGPFTINKAVIVEAPPGVYAAITATGTAHGINIAAGPRDTVVLRDLTVNDQGSTGHGIFFNTGGRLHIESSIANGFSDLGTSSIYIATRATFS
jgi:hypothetical protein